MDTNEELALLRRQVELTEASTRARKRWTAVVLVVLVIVAAVIWAGVRANDRGRLVDSYRTAFSAGQVVSLTL